MVAFLINQESTLGQYGALDSTAFGPGRPVSSFVLRQMARNNTWLMTKTAHVCSMAWPHTYTIGSSTFHGLHLPTPLRWSLVLPPIHVPKMPGHNHISMSISAFINDSASLQLQLATQAAPFDPASPGTSYTADGDNDIDLYGVSAPASVGGFETVGLWIKTSDTDITPLAGTTNQSSVAEGLGDAGQVSEKRLRAVGAGWDTDLEAASVTFFDRNLELLASRNITTVWPGDGNGNELHWSEPLSATELNRIRDAATNVAAPDDWWVVGAATQFGLVGLNLRTSVV